MGKRAVKYRFILSSLATAIPPDKSWMTKKSSKSLKFNTPVVHPKNGRAVVHPKNGRAVVHPQKWPSGRPPPKMAVLLSIPKNGRAVVHPKKWPSSRPPQKWPYSCPSPKMAVRSSTPKNGRAVVHPQKWPSSRPPQKMAERSSTGVLNFRDFEDFFVTQDLSGGITVGNELNIVTFL